MPRKKNKKIILASASSRRQGLLRALGVSFRAVESGYEEDMSLKMDPKKLVLYFSKNKAQKITKRYLGHIIIAADTVVVHKKRVLGKPHTFSQAKKMLSLINGKTISVITGFTVFDTTTNKSISRAEETRVYMKKMAGSEIARYVKTGEPLDKAGAFAIQGFGAVLVRKIEGDYYNVMGLPLYSIAKELEKFDICIF